MTRNYLRGEVGEFLPIHNIMRHLSTKSDGSLFSVHCGKILTLQCTKSVQVYRKGFVFVQQRKISHFSFHNPHFSFGNYQLLVFMFRGLG